MIRKSILLLSLLALIAACKESGEPGLVIKDAMIIDGSGEPAFMGSVRIEGDLITAVGEVTSSDRDRIIDGSGLVLSPGFIDTHSHHDNDTSRTVESAISQGITTIITGQDGRSFRSIGLLYDSLLENPLSVNLGSFAGHNTIRSRILGDDYKRTAYFEELQRMTALLKRELDMGALGLSTGLEYEPGKYSFPDELVELGKIVRDEKGTYISHIRSEDVILKEALFELIRIGKDANIPVHISHMKLAMKDLWGQASDYLDILDSARNIGIDVTADIYPYEAWQSTMKVLFPEDNYDLEAANFALTQLTSPEGIIISRFNADPSYEGKTLNEVADIREESPEETLLELIRLSQETPGESIIATSMSPEDIKTISNWEFANICSDGGPSGHPRGWGAFPRYFNMDTGVSDEIKIHKMTLQGAENLELDSIGLVKPGYYADLVLFDKENLRDMATYENSSQKSEGVEKVIVSGKIVYDENKPTGVYPGRIIRRWR